MKTLRVATLVFALLGALIVPAGAQEIRTSIGNPLAVANGGTGDTGAAWTAYTPTVTPGGGSFTTVSATGRYKVLGKTVWMEAAITITTVGTATGTLALSLPVGTVNGDGACVFRDINVSGKTGSGQLAGGNSSIVNILTYDGVTSFIAASAVIKTSCTYEQN